MHAHTHTRKMLQINNYLQFFFHHSQRPDGRVTFGATFEVATWSVPRSDDGTANATTIDGCSIAREG